MTDSDTYTRTVQVECRPLTATKSGKLARAMKDYRRAREAAIAHLAESDGDADLTYDERESLRKRLSAHAEIDLPARVLYPAITTVAQNYREYEKGTFNTPPTADRADTLGLEGQCIRLFHTDGTYFLDVPTGRGSVALPLRVSNDDWHARRFPAPDAVPPRGRSRTGVPFADLGPGDFPDNTVKLSTSTLTRTGERAYTANLVFQHRKRVVRSGDGARFVVGVDRGRNALASAAVYDVERDHVVDWLQVSGDEIEHRMDEYAARIREFQQAGVWEQMEQARQRRFRYKRQRDNEVATRVVDLARGRLAGVQIALEDLSSMGGLGGYGTESRRFSEWSYGRLRDALAKTAEPYDLPVVTVAPRHTSQVCSRCGADDTRRDGVHFACGACGYEQHADANAAVNIAKRAAGVGDLAADSSDPSGVTP